MGNKITNDFIFDLFQNNTFTLDDVKDGLFARIYGFDLIEIKRNRFDCRHSITKAPWVFNGELGWGGSLGEQFPNRWDITYDASLLCYRYTFVDYIFYEVKIIDTQEQQRLIDLKLLEDQEKAVRQKVLDDLTPVLVHQMMPFNQIYSGVLETKYGVHLKQIQRGMHMHMKYKPRYGNVGWMSNQVLCWGSSTGWDISRDGKIACCRINYDDYVNFEIEILSHEQIKEYEVKMETNRPVKPSIEDRLVTLELLNSKGMLSAEEYVQTRALILSEV
jgi:hypothetical protein